MSEKVLCQRCAHEERSHHYIHRAEVERRIAAALAAKDAEIERLQQAIEAAYRALKVGRRDEALAVLHMKTRLGARAKKLTPAPSTPTHPCTAPPRPDTPESGSGDTG